MPTETMTATSSTSSVPASAPVFVLTKKPVGRAQTTILLGAFDSQAKAAQHAADNAGEAVTFYPVYRARTARPRTMGQTRWTGVVGRFTYSITKLRVR